MVEFISYDGEFPNLCSGTVRFRIGGTEYACGKLGAGGYTAYGCCGGCA